MGRRAKAKELIRRALLRREQGWSQLLTETGLARGALSTNLRQMRKEKEVVLETHSRGGSKKVYKLSERGLIHASVSAISKSIAGQITHVVEKIGRTDPSKIRNWTTGRKKLSLEIEDLELGKMKLTLHRGKRTD